MYSPSVVTTAEHMHVHVAGCAVALVIKTGSVRKLFSDCLSIAIVCKSGNEYYMYMLYLFAYGSKARTCGKFSGLFATQLRW